MNILFDCTSTQPEEGITINGGGEFSSIILKELLKYKNDDISLVFSRQKGKNCLAQTLADENKIMCFWYNDLDELSNIINSKFDKVVFPVCYPVYNKLKINNGIDVLGFVLDMSCFYEQYIFTAPGEFYKNDGLNFLRFLKKKVLRKYKMNIYLLWHKKLFNLNDNTSIYTCSYYSKSALEHFCYPNIVSGVYYCPTNNETLLFEDYEEKEVLNKYELISKSYFLLSSGSRWFKNNYMAIRSLDELMNDERILNKKEDFKVCVLGCTTNIKRFYIKHVKHKDRFVFCDFLDIKELNILYKNAHCFIYPSLLEGFGYPPIEAMKYSTVSLCSTSTSITEICGNGVIYFDPRINDSIKLAIYRSFDEEYMNIIRKHMENRYIELCYKQKIDLDEIIKLILG